MICGVRLQSGAARGELALPRETLKRYRALFDHAISCSAEQLPLLQRQQIQGNIAFLKQVYSRCPKILQRPLERLLVVHGAWLQPNRSRKDELRPRFTIYQDLG